MCAVVRVARLGQAVAVPRAPVEHLQNHGAMVPADRPDGIGRGILVARDSSGAGHFGELVAADHGPRVALAIPFRQCAAGNVGLLSREGRVLPIVRVNQTTLAGEESFTVIPRQRRAPERFFQLLVPKQFRDSQGMNVYFVETFLHRGEINFVGGIRQMPGGSRGTSVHLGIRNDAHLALGVDRVGPNKELV